MTPSQWSGLLLFIGLCVGCHETPAVDKVSPITRSVKEHQAGQTTRISEVTLKRKAPQKTLKTLLFKPGLSPVSDPLTKKIQSECGACHAYPDPQEFTQETWRAANAYMDRIFKEFYPNYTRQLSADVVAGYYEKYAARQRPTPTLYPRTTEHHLRPVPLGPKARILVDLKKMKAGLRVVDMLSGEIMYTDPLTPNRQLAVGRHPVRTKGWSDPERIDEFLFTDLGIFRAADTKRGRLVLVRPGKPDHALLETAGRVTDVAVGDLDSDGFRDAVVGVFGWQETGGLFVIWGAPNLGDYKVDKISTNAGYMSVKIARLQRNQNLKIIAQTAQHHEQIELYSLKKRAVTRQIIFKAPSALWGSLGMHVVDIDRDGDLDILHWNGDTLDAPKLADWQGVHLLKNNGQTFVNTQLASLPGIHDLAVADVDKNGLPDIVAVANLPPRITETLGEAAVGQTIGLESVIKLSQLETNRFEVRSLLRNQTCFASVELIDWNQDGQLDVALGGFGIGWSLLSHHGEVGLGRELDNVCRNGGLFILGNTVDETGRAEKGLSSQTFKEALQRIVENDPDDARNRVNLGNTYLEDKNYRMATRLYKDALEIQPEQKAATLNLALVLDRIGQSTEANFRLQQLVKRWPRFADGHAQLATILYRAKKFEDALKHIDQAINLAEPNPDYLTNKGHILAALRRLDESIGSYEAALKLSPDHKRAKHYLDKVRQRTLLRTP
ncbi:MAG: tetratricopeptide repeat protein [Myxococcota bacterium]|nr:tetratricopeptide repeat protein [Myxococcota bacterium]